MERIRSIRAKALALRTGQTIEVALETERGFVGAAAVPVGISLGGSEAKQVPINLALELITRELAPRLIGADALEQRQIDLMLIGLDNSADRHIFGHNSLLPISLALARAAAAALQKPLYRYIADLAGAQIKIPETIAVVIEGGKHTAGIPAWRQTIQEFSVIALADQIAAATNQVEQTLKNQNIQYFAGVQGGLAIPLNANSQALAILSNAARGIPLAIDVAASHGFITIQEIESLICNFRVAVIEDPVPEDDFASWRQFTAQYGANHIVAADDLTVGDPARIKDAVTQKLANCLVVKLGQTATLSEMLDLIALVQMDNWSHIVSHRGLETMDTFIVDLAVGTGAKFLKIGNPRQAQRQAKFDRLEAIRRDTGKSRA